VRDDGWQIFFQDETWLNEGHAPAKEWVYTIVEKNSKLALTPSSSFSLGMKRPRGKGRRFIISHVGNENGFVPESLDIFQATKGGDYHRKMNCEHFEKYVE